MDKIFILEENNNVLDELVISSTLQLIEKKNSPIPIAVYSARFLNTVPSPSLVDATNQIAGLRPQINCSVCNTGDIHINGWKVLILWLLLMVCQLWVVCLLFMVCKEFLPV